MKKYLRKKHTVVILGLFLISTFLPAVKEIQKQKITDFEQAEQADEIDSVNYKAIVLEEKKYPEAIEFALYSPNLKRTVRLSEYAGANVIVFFWAGWDRYSREQFDMLVSVQKKLNKKEIKIIAVGLDSAEEIKSFFDKKGDMADFITVRGNKYLMESYNVWGLPAIFIIDKEQKIRKKFSGYVSDKTLLKELKKVL